MSTVTVVEAAVPVPVLLRSTKAVNWEPTSTTPCGCVATSIFNSGKGRARTSVPIDAVIEGSALVAVIEAVAVSTPPACASAPTRIWKLVQAFLPASISSARSHRVSVHVAPLLLSIAKGTPPDHDIVNCPPSVGDSPVFFGTTV